MVFAIPRRGICIQVGIEVNKAHGLSILLFYFTQNGERNGMVATDRNEFFILRNNGSVKFLNPLVSHFHIDRNNWAITDIGEFELFHKRQRLRPMIDATK